MDKMDTKTVVIGKPNSVQSQRIIELTQGDFDLYGDIDVMMTVEHTRSLIKELSQEYKNIIHCQFSAPVKLFSVMYFIEGSYSIESETGFIKRNKKTGFEFMKQYGVVL